MIFGNPEKFALFIEPVTYISGMADYDCLGGFVINNKSYISDGTVMLYTQKDLVVGGALVNIPDHEEYYPLPLDDCFKRMMNYRYYNYIAETEEEFENKDSTYYDYNELLFDAQLESSGVGSKRYQLFCIGHEESVRLISYIYPMEPDYLQLSDLSIYEINQCFLTKKELTEIIAKLLSYKYDYIP